jgi:hypothetical protein
MASNERLKSSEDQMLERPLGRIGDASQNQGAEGDFVTCENCGGRVPLPKNGRPRVHAFCQQEDCRRAADALRARLSRAGKRLRPIDPPMPRHVRTVYGDNSALISAVSRLYVNEGDVIADVTWGFGVFWKRFREGRRQRFTVIGSDIRETGQVGAGMKVQADFRRLPYADASIDIVVLDPPYQHCGHYLNNHRYGVGLTEGMRHPQILKLYEDGMAEAVRVLRRKGMLWVKCKDEFDSKQCWTHIEIYKRAGEMGLQAKDLFVLAPRPTPTRRHLRQRHALKTHSYLWVFVSS